MSTYYYSGCTYILLESKAFRELCKKKNNNKENKKETKSQKQAREYMIAPSSVGVDARNRSLVVVGALDWPSYCSCDSASRMYPVKNRKDSIIKVGTSLNSHSYCTSVDIRFLAGITINNNSFRNNNLLFLNFSRRVDRSNSTPKNSRRRADLARIDTPTAIL